MSRRAMWVFAGAALLSGSLTQAAALGDGTVRLRPSSFRLPQKLGPMWFTGERRYSDRRLGRSFGYGASDISLILYVYDYGLRDIPDGPDSLAACAQYEGTKREIERGPNYENVVLRSQASRRMRADADALMVREAIYEFDRAGSRALSALWLTAADGFFVKVRLSMRTEIGDELEEARIQILAALAAAFEARPARVRAASPPPAQTPLIVVDSTLEPADAALWFSYATELNRLAQLRPESLPPCGGTLATAFDDEIAARRFALAQLRSRPRDAASSTNYFATLERVESAGFLEEYAWHYLHAPHWGGSAPEALDLAGFAAFRERELTDHAAQSGAHVRIDAVRVLPAPAAP